MQEKPDPLVGPEVDLKNFPYTPLFRARLFGSSFHAVASDAEWRAGVTLWLKSWDQVPAGSLPADPVQLCRLAELGRDMKTWRKVSLIALHGWKQCSDGRLYHAVVAEGVEKAWNSEQSQRNRTEKARTTRLSQRLSQTKNVAENPSVTDTVADTVTASKLSEVKLREKEEDSEADASGAGAPKPDPVKELWGRAVAILGNGQRSLVGKMRKDYGDVALLEAIVETENECPTDPAAYLIGCCQRRKANAGSRTHTNALDILARAAIEHDEREGHRGPLEAAH